MKTAIVYAGTHGTSAKIANMIQQASDGAPCDIYNLKESQLVPLEKYDQIVAGGSIHAGKMQKKLRTFLDRNMVALLEKRLIMFMTSMNEKDDALQMKNAFPELLRRHAKGVYAVGGEFLFEHMSFFEKLIVRKITGHKSTVSHIRTDVVTTMIHQIQSKP